MATGKFISYLRVSTDKQGKSGLGLEAQRKAVTDYLNGGDWDLLKEVVEVESGKRADRPKLTEAIDLCRVTGATLVVAKLDRLGRNAAFLLNLQESGIDFVACDNPHANSLTVGILAMVAQEEAKAISKRTKEALAAAKARGVQLGAYRDGKFVGRVGTREDMLKAVEARTDKFRQASLDRLPHLRAIDPDGTMSLRKVAEKLNEVGITTVSGRGSWSANSVRRLRAYL